MEVEAVEATPLSLPAAPRRTSRGRAERYDRVLVRVEAGGATGFGEVAPTPTWPNGLTVPACVELIEGALAPAVEGRKLHRTRRTVEAMEAALAGEPFPVAGVEAALHDALGRAANRPVYDLLGGPTERRLPVHRTLGLAEPDDLAARARAAADDGVTDFKCKVGGPDPAAERERVEAVVEAVPDAAIRVDANGAWRADEAVRRLRVLDSAAGGLALIEQPVATDDVEGLRRVRERVDAPVMADESCGSPADVARLARADAVDVVNVKLATAGGFERARDAAAVAAAHGLSVFLGGMFELGVGAAASAHFGAATHLAYPTGVFNARPEHPLIANPEEWTPEGGAVVVPDSPGLGVDLDPEAVERYRTD